MKKLTLIIAAFLMLAATTTNAQMKMRFGPRAGVGMESQTASFMGISITASNILGFHVGGTAEFWFNDDWYLNPSLLYASKGSTSTLDLLILKTTSTTRLNYLEIPILIGYAHDMGGWKL